MVITQTAVRPMSASPSAPAPAPRSEPEESFSWGNALALPAYTYGTASSALSLASAYAQRFPAGGFTLNPGQGIHLNPEWTRNLAPGTFLHFLQPVLAGASALVFAARGLAELNEGRTLAGGVDLAASAASVASIFSPGLGGGLTLALVAARGLLDLH